MSGVELVGGGPHDGRNLEDADMPLGEMPEVRLPHCAHGCPGPRFRYVRGLRVEGDRKRVVYVFAGEVAA